MRTKNLFTRICELDIDEIQIQIAQKKEKQLDRYGCYDILINHALLRLDQLVFAICMYETFPTDKKLTQELYDCYRVAQYELHRIDIEV